MSTKSLWIIYCLFFFIGCKNTSLKQELTLSAPYFGLVPTDTPQILAPGLISTELGEYNGTFSPDGKEFFYTSEVAGKGNIVYTKLSSENNWTKPKIAGFSGKYSEYDPLFSPDGSKLYFSSQRPLDASSDGNQSNIWFIERNERGWGAPQYVKLSEKGDYYSSITHQGNIYFNIWNTGEILKAIPTDTGYLFKALPEVINSRSDVGDPFISPEEDYLIFRAYFNEGYGRGDLYISFNINGNWTTPENLGEPINSNAHEICPYVTTDGKLFVFASDRLEQNYANESLEELRLKYQSHDNGNSNIYYMSADFIERMREKHLANTN